MSRLLFADIIVDVSHESVDRTFQYIVPERLIGEISEGSRVCIPFGKGNRQIEGYVVALSGQPSFAVEKQKEITEIAKNKMPVETELIALAAYIRKTCGGTMNQALKTVLPVRQKVAAVEDRRVALCDLYRDHEENRQELFERLKKRRATARLAFLEALCKAGELDYRVCTGTYRMTASVLADLEEQGILKIRRKIRYRNPMETFADYGEKQESGKQDFDLNEEQSKAVGGIMESGQNVHLLFGITGSGKTRVYIELIRKTLLQGRKAIVLIPEIALTLQTVKRFYEVFGDRIAIVHSRLSAGERFDQFERVKNGDADIMIGPRSAIFAPFADIGMIIVDEEHEGSYKSETVPRYQVRDLAIRRAERHGAKVVLGSATPDIGTYYRAKQGIYGFHSLSKRAGAGKLAQTEIVDLREELENGNKSMFSQRLNELILDRLKKKEQILLYINRRGYAGFVSCRSCGEVIRCPHCDVSLTYHGNDTLVCHYCGHTIPMPEVCPECGSKYIARFGTGTEKVEEMVRKYYPSARVLRMDGDTTATKGAHERLIGTFMKHEADILIGTQMIVKGHDFPDVTLVAAMAADLSLYASDYRAAERTFELLTQAAGRAGRGASQGIALIQTYQPEHYAIVAAAAQDYRTFYEKELSYRQLMEYPPFYDILAILVSSPSQEDAEKMCMALKELAQGQAEEYTLIGPAKAGVAKVKDVYREVLYIKHKSSEKLFELKKKMEDRFSGQWGKTSVTFDFNPMNSY